MLVRNLSSMFDPNLPGGSFFMHLFSASSLGTSCAILTITLIIDGPRTGGTPKACELYVGSHIADLSEYGIGLANNGGGTDGVEFTFPAVSVSAGTFIYVASESTEFTNYFGFSPDYVTPFMACNGDDALELFHLGARIDLYGDPAVLGTGTAWDYLDGYAYRKAGTHANTAFVEADWTFSGANALDGGTTDTIGLTGKYTAPTGCGAASSGLQDAEGVLSGVAKMQICSLVLGGIRVIASCAQLGAVGTECRESMRRVSSDSQVHEKLANTALQHHT